jgi:hypothetical protein
MFGAQASSNADKFNGFADECMAEYDLDCCKVPDLSDPGELSYPVMRGVSNRSLCERPLCANSGPSPIECYEISTPHMSSEGKGHTFESCRVRQFGIRHRRQMPRFRDAGEAYVK